MSRRRRVLAASALVCALLLALAPAAAFARTGPDPMRQLAGDSPLCTQAVDAQAHRNCAATGALEHPYPIDHYRFDWHITTGVTHVEENLQAAIQWVTSIVWTLLLYLLKAVLLIFQWAFSIDLLGKAMGGVHAQLERLHNTTLGQPWFTAAVSILALWAIWRGLVQRQHTKTLAGIGIAVAMMVAALIVISRPAETVGIASRGANAVGLSILSGASQGTLNHPQMAVSRSSEQLFSTMVLRPWCAIEFGNVGWCLAHAPGDPLTRAERWLRYEPGTPERNAEYNIIYSNGTYKPDNPKLQRQLAGYKVDPKRDRPNVDMQGKSKTLFRVGLIALVAIGQLGACVVIGYLAIALLLQAMLTLVWLLLAPAALFAPAFGEGGRDAFRKWGLSLIAAVVSKATFALVLAVVLSVAEMLANLAGQLSWFVAWLLWAIYWWGLFKMRRKLLEKLSLGGHEANAKAAGSLYYRIQSGKMAAGAAGAFLGATAGRAWRRGRDQKGSLLDRTRARREAGGEAVAELSREQLRERAGEQLQHKYDDYHARVARHDDAERKIGSLNRGLRRYDQRVEKAREEGKPEAEVAGSRQEKKMAAQRRALQAQLLPRHELGVARKFIETADHNQVEQGRRFSDKQIDVAAAGLRQDLHSDKPADDPIHAWRAGMPREQLEKLSPDAREALNRRITDDLERDRHLLAASPDDDQVVVPGRRARRKAARALDHKQVRERRGEQLRQRKEQRAAQGLQRRELERVLHRRSGRRR